METNTTTLEERLKHWHIRCLNCDNKVATISKDVKQIFRDDECSDCHQKIHTRIGVEITFKQTSLDGQWTIINCRFTDIGYIRKWN